MIGRFFDWWYRRQRQLDIDFIWPALKSKASNLEQARAAFYLHAYQDWVWIRLGPVELHRVVDSLK